jgi:hypothetical protein
MATQGPSSGRPSRFTRLGLWAFAVFAVSVGLTLFALSACK